jgi:hypothetical protein
MNTPIFKLQTPKKLQCQNSKPCAGWEALGFWISLWLGVWDLVFIPGWGFGASSDN